MKGGSEPRPSVPTAPLRRGRVPSWLVPGSSSASVSARCHHHHATSRSSSGYAPLFFKLSCEFSSFQNGELAKFGYESVEISHFLIPI